MSEPGGAGPATPATPATPAAPAPPAPPAAGTTAAAANAGRAALAPVSGEVPRDVSATVRAAAITGAWNAVESTLQTVVGPRSRPDTAPPLPRGQDLVRALRQGDLISLDQGHALLDLLAVAERGRQSDYEFSDEDVTAAQDALARLQPPPSPSAPSARTAAHAAPATADQTHADDTGFVEATAAPSAGSRHTVAYFVGGLLVFVLAAGGLAFAIARRGGTERFRAWPFGESARARGIAAYDAGRRDEAHADFRAAVRADSSDPIPHVYLGRLARESGDMATAREELIAAVRMAPRSAVAQRELGSYYLAAGNPDLARRFYVRAVTLDPSDQTALGFLGCALARLHRSAEAARFLSRAGAGPWTACASGGAPEPGSSPAVPPPPGSP